MSRTTLPIWEGAGKKANMCFFTCCFCQHNPVPPCWSWLIFFNFGFTEKIANKKIIFFCVFKKRNFLGRAEKINKLVKKNWGFLTRGLKQQETWSFFAQKSEVNEVHKYFLLILSNWHLVGSWKIYRTYRHIERDTWYPHGAPGGATKVAKASEKCNSEFYRNFLTYLFSLFGWLEENRRDTEVSARNFLL